MCNFIKIVWLGFERVSSKKSAQSDSFTARAALVHRSCLSFRSDNFLLKLLGQQVAMDNQVNNMHHLSSKPVEAEQASQQNRTGSVNSNNHVRNQFMNMSVNPAAAVNNSMVRPYLNYSSYSELPLQIRIAV